MTVYCPSCEASVEATAKFCLACGNDFSNQSPITASGHDISHLKEAIRSRDDLSMADKFNLIAQIEEGADPVALGIAAPADDDEVGQETATAADILTNLSGGKENANETTMAIAGAEGLVKISTDLTGVSGHPAAVAAAKIALENPDQQAELDIDRIVLNPHTVTLDKPIFRKGMELGIDASKHVHEVAIGEEGARLDKEAIESIPVLDPPKRSFCPKCGSDIQNHAVMQWKKWTGQTSEVVELQVDAAMQAALAFVAGHFQQAIEKMNTEKTGALTKVNEIQLELDSLDIDKVRLEVRDSLKKEVEEELTPKLKEELIEEVREEIEDEVKSQMLARGGAARTTASRSGKTNIPTNRPKKKAEPDLVEKPEEAEEKEVEKEVEKPKPPPKKPDKPKMPMFGGGPPKKKYEGEEADKPDWFLTEALETVYDPHGTSKKLTPRTILSRSKEGNVRVEDVVRIYASDGEDGLSDLAWTSPFTKYIIEAYDAC